MFTYDSYFFYFRYEEAILRSIPEYIQKELRVNKIESTVARGKFTNQFVSDLEQYSKKCRTGNIISWLQALAPTDSKLKYAAESTVRISLRRLKAKKASLIVKKCPEKFNKWKLEIFSLALQDHVTQDAEGPNDTQYVSRDDQHVSRDTQHHVNRDAQHVSGDTQHRVSRDAQQVSGDTQRRDRDTQHISGDTQHRLSRDAHHVSGDTQHRVSRDAQQVSGDTQHRVSRDAQQVSGDTQRRDRDTQHISGDTQHRLSRDAHHVSGDTQHRVSRDAQQVSGDTQHRVSRDAQQVSGDTQRCDRDTQHVSGDTQHGLSRDAQHVSGDTQHRISRDAQQVSGDTQHRVSRDAQQVSGDTQRRDRDTQHRVSRDAQHVSGDTQHRVSRDAQQVSGDTQRCDRDTQHVSGDTQHGLSRDAQHVSGDTQHRISRDAQQVSGDTQHRVSMDAQQVGGDTQRRDRDTQHRVSRDAQHVSRDAQHVSGDTQHRVSRDAQQVSGDTQHRVSRDAQHVSGDTQHHVSRDAPHVNEDTQYHVSRDVSSLRQKNLLEYEVSKKKLLVCKLSKKIKEKKMILKSTTHTVGHYSVRNVNKRDKKAAENRKTIVRLRQKVKELNFLEERRTQQGLQIKEKDEAISVLQSKVAEMDTLNHKLEQAKKKVLYEQKCKSKLRVKVSKLNNDDAQNISDLEEKVHSLNSLVRDLENELETARDSLRDAKQVSFKDEFGEYTLNLRVCVNNLTALEIAQDKVSPTIKTVAADLFDIHINEKELPCRKTVQNINDEGQYIAKRYIAEKLTECSNWGLNKDGTTRKKQKLLDTTVTLDSGKTVSLGFRRVANETSETISNITKCHIEELAKVAVEDDPESFIQSILQKLSFYMSDRAANEKKSNVLLDEWRSEMLSNFPNGKEPQVVHHFFCMLHTLLGFHKNSVNLLKKRQFMFVAEFGRSLGRDDLEQFSDFREEFVAERTVRMVSETFGPVGDYLGLRDVWESHCASKGVKSKISSYKDNRFNGLFQVSAQVLHHREDFIYILDNVNLSNKKLQSVAADLKCGVVCTFLQALAIAFLRITGPYYNLMESNVPYLEIYRYIQSLYEYLQVGSADAQHLLTNSLPTLAEFTDQSTEIYKCLLTPVFPEFFTVLQGCIQDICLGCMKTVETQLKDFLLDGKYGMKSLAAEVRRTKFSHLTNLTCEHNFGDLDSSQRRRPNCTLHHHSTVHLLKRNKEQLQNWYNQKSDEEKASLWKDAKRNGKILRKLHSKAEKDQLEVIKKIKLVGSDLPGDNEQQKSDSIAELEEVLPTVFCERDWVAVAYQDRWYPGLFQIHFWYN